MKCKVPLCGVAAAVTLLLPAVSLAQPDALAPSIARARQFIDDGRPAEALAVLRKLPASAEGERLRVAASVAASDFAEAVDAYEELAGRWKSPSPDLLTTIARSRALVLRGHADPEIRVTACEGLMLAAPVPECATELQATANDAAIGFESRLAAARVLVEHQATGAAVLLESVIQQGMQKSPTTTAAALAQLPARISNEPLTRLLDSQDADARYLAALALAGRRLPDTAAPLRAVATDPQAGAARLIAYIALAAMGDQEGIRVLRETLPLMKGRTRLEAARALATLKDPAAAPMLEELLTSEHDMIRIETAELLYSARPAQASTALRAAVESGNPWIRASAIAAATRVGMPVTQAIRRAIADSSPRVAAAAACAILKDPRTDSRARR